MRFNVQYRNHRVRFLKFFRINKRVYKIYGDGIFVWYELGLEDAERWIRGVAILKAKKFVKISRMKFEVK